MGKLQDVADTASRLPTKLLHGYATSDDLDTVGLQTTDLRVVGIRALGKGNLAITADHPVPGYFMAPGQLAQSPADITGLAPQPCHLRHLAVTGDLAGR